MKIYQLIFLLIVLVFMSCASHQERNTYQESSISNYQSKAISNDSRMMLYSASLIIETNNPDSLSAKIVNIAEKYDGYLVSVRSDQVTLRVESSTLYRALEEIATLGKLKDKNVQGMDVSDELTNNKIRLTNAVSTHNRYLEMLKIATTIDEVLKVEKELERLSREIDLLEGKINKTEHLVSYSTISVKCEEKIKPGILGYIGLGLYKGIKWLFVR